ncbi:hypothetical protein QNI19_14425 [Cytophagaceae bacterium DM2B3-1]|uniref:VOC domain-containing protein n=1 Tax=Xanthocytophaga flava TaxID=3048013 RepID=A0ABT7CKS8_9BACT|nr:glyoxalase superfamily protein [Xanthocytophaga flavus]MDJ1469352.1 hypothetical protein [Xanthocytophaga flavus]MDJ1494136.1 hypothetical protein [Xanthocytophaga flavus]
MKIVPVIKYKNMEESVLFYTQILDFELKYAITPLTFPVVNLIKEGSELQLSTLSGDSVFGIAINIYTQNVDALFQKYRERGLDTSQHMNSPVHQSPVDQDWGIREFYVTDPSGNTLRFGESILEK